MFDVIQYGHERLYCPDCVKSQTSKPYITEALYDDVKTFLKARGVKIFHG